MKINKTGKALLIVLVLLVVIVIAVSNMKVPNVSIADIDFSTITDGTYEGSYVLGPVKARVEVRVSFGRVADIAITEHRNGKGLAGEAIVDSVVSAQSLDVDIISGATWSSRTLLKAIEDALQGNPTDGQ